MYPENASLAHGVRPSAPHLVQDEICIAAGGLVVWQLLRSKCCQEALMENLLAASCEKDSFKSSSNWIHIYIYNISI